MSSEFENESSSGTRDAVEVPNKDFGDETVYLSCSEDNDAGKPLQAIKRELELSEQRKTIRCMLSEQDALLKEGDSVFVMKQKWIDELIVEYGTTQHFKEAVGPIDTNGIMSPDGIFCDSHATPLLHLTPNLFELLVNWYGLTPNSRPVSTYIIEMSDGTLVPEYAKPSFFLHHLSSENIGSSYSTAYATIPYFAISSLRTFNDLVQLSITKLDEKEKISRYDPVGFSKKKFRVWIVTDENLQGLNYSVTPAQFMTFNQKVLLKKQFLASTIKQSGLHFGHLLIEEKKIVNPTKKNSSENYWPSRYYIQHPPSPSDGRIGLQNLGNTCYMNSALQCLVHVPELTQYFLFKCYQSELNPDNPLGMSGKVAISFANLVSNLFDKRPNRGRAYTPREFKQTIGHFNHMFSGYQQQDSQEFLAFLLDGLHEDLNRILKKPITEKPEINDKDSDEAIKLLAEKSWRQHKLRNDSIIVDLFTGLYKSTLICPKCSKISITFDPFSDLTLPLPVNNLWSSKILLFLENGPIKQFDVELTKNSTYSTLKKYVADKLLLNPDHLITCEIWSDQFYKNFESSQSQSGYLPISDLISNNDIIVMYEVKHSDGDIIIPVLNTVLPESGIPSAFGIPFFIAVSDQEKNSYGAIRKKLEHKYEQLSTYDYFSKRRVSKIDDIMTDDCDSDVSLDVSQVPGDYGFKVKIFDGSREIKAKRRNHNFSFRSQSQHKSMLDRAGDEKVWTPTSSNNFTNLPLFLDSVHSKRKKLYSECKDAILGKEKESEVSQAHLELTDSDDELKDYVEVSPVYKEQKPESDSGDSVDAQLTVLTGNLEEEKLTDSFAEERDMDTVVVPETITKRKMALVCEWDAELFDVFFSGLEDEGQGGKNTWSDPEIMSNEEVEEAKKQREASAHRNLTLEQCLRLFSKPEVLGEQDLWYCSNCKEHRQATKQIEIWSTPDILSIHLKRFENQRSFSDKIDAVVDFPLEGLDMTPFLAASVKNEKSIVYDLFAVDNHYGGLGGGHYTSYVKNFIDNEWYYYDDSRVSKTSPEKSISGAAYLLFYRRRSSTTLGGDALAQMLQTARESFEAQEQSELERLEHFYTQSYESSSAEEEDDDDGDGDGDKLDYEPVGGDNRYELAPSPKKLDSDDESIVSDNDVSSIPVGSEDENDLSASRRKQRLLRRAGGNSIRGFTDTHTVQSEGESAAANSTTSSSDGLSPTVNIPGAYPSKEDKND